MHSQTILWLTRCFSLGASSLMLAYSSSCIVKFCNRCHTISWCFSSQALKQSSQASYNHRIIILFSLWFPPLHHHNHLNRNSTLHGGRVGWLCINRGFRAPHYSSLTAESTATSVYAVWFQAAAAKYQQLLVRQFFTKSSRLAPSMTLVLLN